MFNFKRSFIIVAVTALVSFAGTLTKTQVENIFAVSKPLSDLGEKYPEMDKAKENLDYFTDGGKSIAIEIKKVGAYQDAQKIVQSAGFSNVEDYTAQLTKVMTAVFAVQKEQMVGVNKEMVQKQMVTQKEQMKAMGLDEKAIESFLKDMEKSIAMLEVVDKSAKFAEPNDVLFVRENIEWIMKLMSEMK